MSRPGRRRLLAAAAALIATGCSPGDSLGEAVTVSAAEWLEVGLADGRVRAVAAPDARALAGERWRTSHILFRRLPAGTGRPADGARLLPGGGEPEDAVSGGSDGLCHIAVFELTARQWAAIAGTAAAGDAASPACGMAPAEAAAALGSFRLSRYRLDLPAAELWTQACGGGQPTLFAWGDGSAAAPAFAVHHPQEDPAPQGPARPGSLQPNGLGLYDMHGNVWELVREADGRYAARGGAWDSPILQCRTANTVPLPDDAGHPAVGLRPVLLP